MRRRILMMGVAVLLGAGSQYCVQFGPCRAPVPGLEAALPA